MRFLCLAALGTVAFATPQTGKVDPGGTPGNRGRNTENDVTTGACKDIMFIMARASSEPGNMVSSAFPARLETLLILAEGWIDGTDLMQRIEGIIP
jgi:hypothetical protein